MKLGKYTRPTLPMPPQWEAVGDRIYVESNASARPDFLERIKSDLDLIASKEVGNRLITKLQAGRAPIFIRYGNINRSIKAGSDTLFAITINIDLQEKKTRVIGEEELVICPSFIVLAHELIHAYHTSYRKSYPKRECNVELWTNSEEEYTIKGYDVAGRIRPKITENAIRKEHGLKERVGHHLRPFIDAEKEVSSSRASGVGDRVSTGNGSSGSDDTVSSTSNVGPSGIGDRVSTGNGSSGSDDTVSINSGEAAHL